MQEATRVVSEEEIRELRHKFIHASTTQRFLLLLDAVENERYALAEVKLAVDTMYAAEAREMRLKAAVDKLLKMWLRYPQTNEPGLGFDQSLLEEVTALLRGEEPKAKAKPAGAYAATNATYREIVRQIQVELDQALRDHSGVPAYIGPWEELEADLKRVECEEYREALEKIQKLLGELPPQSA